MLKPISWIWNNKISTVSLVLFVAFVLYAIYFNILWSLVIADEITIPWYNKEKAEKEFEEQKEKNPSFYIGSREDNTLVSFVVSLIGFPILTFLLFFFRRRINKAIEEERDSWLAKILKKVIIANSQVKNVYIWLFHIFEYIYFALSIGGLVLAIQYPKSGAFISLVGTVEQKIYEKIKDHLIKRQESKKVKLGIENRIQQLREITLLEEIVILNANSSLEEKKTINPTLNNLKNKTDQLIKLINQPIPNGIRGELDKIMIV